MSKSLYQTQIENRAPTSSDIAQIGNWWIDTSASPNALYLYKASGWELQGGGSGKYQHNIRIFNNNALVSISYISSNSTKFTSIADLTTDMASNTETDTKSLCATGFFVDSSELYIVSDFTNISGQNNITVSGSKFVNTGTPLTNRIFITLTSTVALYDTVITL